MRPSFGKRIFISVALTAVLGVAGLATASTPPGGFHGLRVEPPKAIRGGTLLDAQGRATGFPLATGKWQLVFFGYTHCQDVCPLTLHKTVTLLKQLGAEEKRLQVVFISIDGSRDSPGAVKQFTGKFDARILGLTAGPETLQPIENEFNVLTRRFQGKTALAYTLEHSSFLYLLDPRGRIRMLYPMSADVPAMAQDLHALWRTE